MVLKLRTRVHSGSRTCFGTTAGITVESGRDELLISTSNNPGGANPFEARHEITEGSTVTSKSGSNPEFVQWPTSLFNLSLGTPSMPPVSASDFQRTLANTNPANPVINVPNFLWELKDLPDMIRQGGRVANAIRQARSWKDLIRPESAVRDAAAANLAYQFGWRPFVSDLIKLAKLQASLEKRRKMFEKLKTRGLRGRVSLGSQSEQFVVNGYPLVSECGAFISSNVIVSLKAERWGTARWSVTSGMSLPQTDGEILRHMTGFTAGNITLAVWESLPWSWLADWIGSVDGMIKANNRTIATPSHCCVMTRSETTVAHPGIIVRGPNQEHDLAPGKKRIIRHERMPQFGVLPQSASFPLLTGNQLSILGSLFVLRTKRGR